MGEKSNQKRWDFGSKAKRFSVKKSYISER